MPKEGNGKKPVVDGDPETTQTLDALVADRTEELLRVTESLVREVNEREKIGVALEEQLRFERLLSDVSARFLRVSPARLDGEIENALKRVLDFFQVDRCALIQSMPGKTAWRISHAVSSAKIPTVPVGVELPRSLNPWAFGRLIAGHVLSFTRPEETPPEAESDRTTWREWGIRSNLNIPILTGDSVDHVIAINSVVHERDWPEEFIPRLRLLGEIVVSAIERSNVEQALRESEERLNLAADSAEARLWELDLDSGIIWVTEKGRLFYGLTPGDEMTLERLVSHVHPEDRRLIREAIETARSGKDLRLEYRVEVTPGNFRWINSLGRMSPDHAGRPYRVMGVSIDVTDRKVT
nr:PAS domain-containing protein [Syntrophales bacterium]